MARAIATETNERYMWPCIAGKMSSQKFSESQSHSMSFGSSSEMSCRSARAPPLLTRGVPGAGKGLYGLYGQQAPLAVVLDDGLGAAGADQLGERVPHGQVPVYAREAFGVAVRRLEPHVAHPGEREPLEDPVVADEGGDELGVRVREDLLGGVVLGEEAALLEDGDLVAHLYRLVYVVGDEDDGLLYVLLDAHELVLEPLARDGVNGAEGLVHEHDRGVGGHGAGHPDPLLLPARELRRVAVAVVVGVEPDEPEKLVHARPDAPPLPAEQPRHGGDVLGDGAVGEEPYLLDGVADLASELGAAHRGVRLAVYEDLALRRLDEPVHHPHARGLAAPGGAHQNANLPFGNFEGEIVDHGPVGAWVSLADVLKLDHYISCAPKGSTAAGRCNLPSQARPRLLHVLGDNSEKYTAISPEKFTLAPG